MEVQAQQAYAPLVLNLSLKGTRVKATVVGVERGTTLKSCDFSVAAHLIPMFGSKKRAFENLLQHGKLTESLNAMRDIGELVYDSVFKHLGLEYLFDERPYRVHILAQDQARAIPVELAYHGGFLVESNIVSLRGRNDATRDSVAVKRVLVLADPAARCSGALREGEVLYDYFVSAGLSVVLVSRPLQKEKLIELFRSADIVHYCGHVASQSSRTGWDIGTTIFSCDEQGQYSKAPALIITNGCGNTLPLGFRFLSGGVLNCIGTRWQIPDSDFCSFVLSFYESLFRIGDIGFTLHYSQNARFARRDILPLIFALQGESGIHYEKSDF
jgi:hypothetical protein